MGGGNQCRCQVITTSHQLYATLTLLGVGHVTEEEEIRKMPHPVSGGGPCEEEKLNRCSMLYVDEDHVT